MLLIKQYLFSIFQLNKGPKYNVTAHYQMPLYTTKNLHVYPKTVF